MNNRYKAIGFDWGGVLNGQPGKVFGQQMAKLLGVTHEQYLTAYFHHNKKINRGEIDWPQLWALVLGELGKLDKLPKAIALAEATHRLSPNQKVINLVDKLKAAGYKVGLLSNNTDEKAAQIRATSLQTHFDVFHISSETGYVKPEPETFNHFAKALGVKLEELIFIDDAEKSLSTAKECGYTPILFDSYDQLVSELEKLKIL